MLSKIVYENVEYYYCFAFERGHLLMLFIYKKDNEETNILYHSNSKLSYEKYFGDIPLGLLTTVIRCCDSLGNVLF